MYSMPRDAENATEETILTGKELADLLGVSGPTLSEAAKKGYTCAGYPVHEWAVEYESGRIKGYDVPSFLLLRHDWKGRKQQDRQNPENADETKEKEMSRTNDAEEAQEHQVTNNYSLFPAGENYAETSAMVSVPLVLREALKNDTPLSRTVISGGLSLLFAIAAYSMTKSAAGGAVGAATGLGISYYYLNHQKTTQSAYLLPELNGGYSNRPINNVSNSRSAFSTP